MGAFSPRELKKEGRSRYTSSLSHCHQSKRTHRINNSLTRHALVESG